MTRVYLNRVATATPPNDVHENFIAYAPTLLSSPEDQKKFRLLTRRAQIDHRYSVLQASRIADRADDDGFYRAGDFPTTRARMALYKKSAFPLVRQALDRLNIDAVKDKITHVIVTSCTGFYAPGLDQDIIRHYSLDPSVERTIVGFMGCQAAINALKLARHAVRSRPDAHVLIVNLELCTLHLQELDDLDQLMSFLVFADGCAASLVSAEPEGLGVASFHSAILPDSQAQITWHIGDRGFDMVLAREVPSTIAAGITPFVQAALDGHAINQVRHWAVHPGGSAILDAVGMALSLNEDKLKSSRKVLRQYGNMSSATLMFVLQDLMESNPSPGIGCALAFGPGLTAESMIFHCK